VKTDTYPTMVMYTVGYMLVRCHRLHSSIEGLPALFLTLNVHSDFLFLKYIVQKCDKLKLITFETLSRNT